MPTWITLITKSAPSSARRRSASAVICGVRSDLACRRLARSPGRLQPLGVDVVQHDAHRGELREGEHVAEQVAGEHDTARADDHNRGSHASRVWRGSSMTLNFVRDDEHRVSHVAHETAGEESHVPAPDVLVIGDANPDLVLTGDVVPGSVRPRPWSTRADLVLGGSAAIVACGLARLGVPTALAATVGDDAVRRASSATPSPSAGWTSRWLRTDPAVATGLSVVLSVGDRAILTYPGTIASTGPRSSTRTWWPVRHVHSASFFLLPRLAAHLPRRVRPCPRGRRRPRRWTPTGTRPGRGRASAACSSTRTCCCPTPRSCSPSPAAHDRDEAARVVLDRGCQVALKDGADGGVLWQAPDLVTRVAAPYVAAIDTTGAGDSFDAGFISALVAGLPPEECLVRAVACGSLSTRAVGGTAGQPTLEELPAGFRAAPPT